MSTQRDRTMELLRTIAHDVAHELRGPVQSILVNLEVLRRRAQAGDANATLERADIIEQEIRRLHTLSDAFLGLLRIGEPEPGPIAAELLLAALDPIIAVLARSSRLELERHPLDDALFVHVRREPVALALLELFLAVSATCSAGDTMVLSGAHDDATVVIRIEGSAARLRDDAGAADALDRARLAAAARLDGEGTVTREPVSQNGGAVVCLRLPRAASLTPPSPQD